MNIERFILKRPYLYHLTDRRNLDSILADKQLKSTKLLSEISEVENAYQFLTTKRNDSKEISGHKSLYFIRDQKPLLEKVLRRSLDKDCSYEQFLMSLNSRVFFWPTLKDLSKHFKTYQNEKPVILRINTQDTFAINSAPKFCKLNSGATRCVSYYSGNAAPRGHNTFFAAEQSSYTYSQIREVTFEKYCNLPNSTQFSYDPLDEFKVAK